METIKTKTSVIRVFLLLFALLILPRHLNCQSCYSPFIDSVISQVSLQNITNYNLELTGEVQTVVGGQPCTIISRYWESPFNQKAAQYIYEKFQSFGLETRYQTYSSTGVNVLAKKTGTEYPNQQILICAHYDNIVNGLVPDTTYGADDNASGTCCVLEAARILRNYNSAYTLIFAAWDEEELWMVGSNNYADTAVLHQDSIVCVFNLDMIAYDANNDGVYRILSDTPSVEYAQIFSSCGYLYQPELVPDVYVGPSASDHLPFQERGYKAICAIEDAYPDFNAYYHTIYERFDKLNPPYFERIVKTAIAALLTVDNDLVIFIQHDPLQSTKDTSSRVVTTVIRSNHIIARNWYSKTINAPRLYWRVGDGSFSYTNDFYCHQDTFKFLIPGQPEGSIVYYYLAAQDSLCTLISSMPGGASGMSPPGTVPPPELFSYEILSSNSWCSYTTPRTLTPMQQSFDTIHISQTGLVHDCNLNLTIYHSNDSDLYIWLTRPGYGPIQLSQGNGGDGDNYFNTTFDDEASIPITQGVPPFIGSYQPELPLSGFDNKELQGDWILRIYNHSQSVTGNLSGWCLSFDYFNPIGIINNQLPVSSSLSQNYPNPFNSSTRINFSLAKKSHVKITLYDMLGREVTVLTDNIYNSGENNLFYNANNLASGLYFYIMFIDNNLFKSKKMVLIK